MSSPCRASTLVLVCALAAAGCDRETRDPRGHPLPEGTPLAAAVAYPRIQDPRAKDYIDNAYQVSQGQTYYHWMNCSGCHAEGGGGMGPALMDNKWRYGSSMASIVQTITYGRPNGMPPFKDRMTPQQIWQVASFVRTMSARTRQDVRPSRAESMNLGEPSTLRDPRRPVALTPKQDEATRP